MGVTMSLPFAMHAALVVVLIVAGAVWVGGFVVLVVVAGVAGRTLEPGVRVAFFRALGRRYGVVGGVALAAGLVASAVLLAHRPWTGLLTAAATVAGLLVLASVAGVVQARRLTRLRRRALAEGADAVLAARVRRTARRARLLRAGIGGLSPVLVVLGALLSG